MSAPTPSPSPADAAPSPVRLGVVSFLNTLPLIDGLEQLRELELAHSVPSLLIDALLGGAVDLALCSSIDYLRSPVPLAIVPVGLLGCDGPTLTVRLYATRPIEEIERIHCDTDSHTSVALMQILLRERWGLEPELVDYDAREHVADNRPVPWPDAMLLIGDKVVTDSPPAVRYPHQLDLGATWAEHTGLPFVFALWLARADADPARVRLAAAVLDRQRRQNRERLPEIIHRCAPARRWPRDLAAQYLGRRLVFDLDERLVAALELFYDEAVAHGLVATRRPLRFAGIGEPEPVAAPVTG